MINFKMLHISVTPKIKPESIATVRHSTAPDLTRCIKDGGICGAGGYCVKCVLETEGEQLKGGDVYLKIRGDV